MERHLNKLFLLGAVLLIAQFVIRLLPFTSETAALGTLLISGAVAVCCLLKSLYDYAIISIGETGKRRADMEFSAGMKMFAVSVAAATISQFDVWIVSPVACVAGFILVSPSRATKWSVIPFVLPAVAAAFVENRMAHTNVPYPAFFQVLFFAAAWIIAIAVQKGQRALNRPNST
jgi:hypothetical protein